jgi:hypothetical protein
LEEDYDVMWDGRVVGRIYRRAGVAENAQPWFWSVLAIAPGIATSGIAATLDEAKRACARKWRECAEAGD